MRLNMEEVQKQHESTKKLYEQGLTVAPVDVKRVLDLYDTIEALQQENNDWQERYYELDAGHSRLFKDFCKLQQENEQLADETIKLMKENAKNSNKKDKLVKVLKQAREAIQRAKENFEPYGEYEYDVRYDLEEAIVEIDEKQLQALIDCEEKEDCTGETCPIFEICDNDYTNKVVAETAQTALAYREMLERLEWIEHKDWLVECCPFCKKGKTQGHAPDCELAKLLKGSEVE